MKKFKKVAAMTVAAAMLVSSGLTVLAEGNEGGDTGNGEYEGYVDETSVFSVKVPTSAANVFDFFVDPNGLLKATDYARFDGEASADDFEDGATLFFARTVAGDVTEKYGKDSDAVELVNMSSYEVNVEVTASIDGATGITLADSSDVSSAQNPTLYLAIVSDSSTEVITSAGGQFTGTIAGKDENFEVQWDSGAGKYVYKLIAGTTEDSPTTPWETVSFKLTGACGGTWTDAQAEVAPVVTLTWKVTDPYAKAAPSIAKSEYEYVAGQALAVPVDLGLGDLAATGIASITFKNGSTVTTLPTSRYSFSKGKLTFTAEYTNLIGGSRTHTIKFNDAAGTTLELTLIPWRTDVAPSVEKTTYEYVAGQSLAIPVDLGRGELAATDIVSVTFKNGGTTTTLPTSRYSFSDGKLIFTDEYTKLIGGSRTHTVTFNDKAGTVVELTLNPKN